MDMLNITMAFADLAGTAIDTLVKVGLTLFGFWIGYSSKRPHLELGGGGSGTIRIPGKDVMASSLTIYNKPSFFGLPINRDAATITEARIYDPELKEYVGPCLMWRSEDDGNVLVREYSIGSGRQATIYVFAKERYADEFFVFASNRLNDPLPKQLTRYKEKKKEFGLYIRDVNGRKYEYDLIVRNTEQSVNVGFKRSRLKARLQLLRRALGPM